MSTSVARGQGCPRSGGCVVQTSALKLHQCQSFNNFPIFNMLFYNFRHVLLHHLTVQGSVWMDHDRGSDRAESDRSAVGSEDLRPLGCGLLILCLGGGLFLRGCERIRLSRPRRRRPSTICRCRRKPAVLLGLSALARAFQVARGRFINFFSAITLILPRTARSLHRRNSRLC